MWKLPNPFRKLRQKTYHSEVAPPESAPAQGPVRAAFLIPGNWEDRSAFIQSLVKSSDGRFLFAGMVLLDNERDDHVQLQFFERKIDLTEQFEIASGYRIQGDELAAIGSHKSFVRIIVDIADSKRLFDQLLRFTGAIRDAGGLAVKVECAGVAHPWPDWAAMLDSDSPDDHYFALIGHVVIDDADLVSFGMSHHGKPDAEVLNCHYDPDLAYVLSTFNRYQYLEDPVFQNGQTFSCGPGEQVYRLEWREDDRYDPNDWFFNPFGIWQLSPIDDAPDATAKK